MARQNYGQLRIDCISVVLGDGDDVFTDGMNDNQQEQLKNFLKNCIRNHLPTKDLVVNVKVDFYDAHIITYRPTSYADHLIILTSRYYDNGDESYKDSNLTLDWDDEMNLAFTLSAPVE